MSNIPNVNMKNTKQEIMDALKESMRLLKEKQANSFSPTKQIEKQKETEVLESAKESVEKNLFSEELNKKYNELNEAIEINTKKLEESYEIEKELQNLIAIVNTSQTLKEKLEDDYQAKKEELETEFKKFKKELEQKQKELTEEYETIKQELEIERKRENEKYTYDTKRQREKENDSWTDEKEKRELEMQKKEEEIEKTIKELEEKKDKIKELEDKVEDIPNVIEKAKSEGKEEAAKELGREYGYKKTMAEKEYTYEKQRLQDKIDSLSAELEKANSEKNILQAKLDGAYTELSTLATKTVESSGGVKILNGNNNDSRK